jgi:hypothetical protein
LTNLLALEAVNRMDAGDHPRYIRHARLGRLAWRCCDGMDFAKCE